MAAGKRKKKANANAKKDGEKLHQKPQSPPIHVPPITTAFCILFSLGGYFYAAEYNDLLDEYKLDELQMQSEDDINNILNAMDICEEERGLFATAVENLGAALSSYMHNYKKGKLIERYDEYSGDEFYNVEMAATKLHHALDSYQLSLKKQREQVLLCQRSIQQSISMYSRNESINAKHRNSENLIFINNAHIHSRHFVQDYLKQLSWDKLVIAKLREILNDGELYNCNDDKVDGLVSDSNSSYTLHHSLLNWGGAIRNCSILNKKKWTEGKEFIMSAIRKYSSLNSKNDRIDVVKPQNYSDDIVDFEAFLSHVQNSNKNRHSISTQSGNKMHGREYILLGRTIEETVNIFLEKDVLIVTRDINDTFTDKKSKEGSQELYSNNAIPTDSNCLLFLHLVGQSSSGKTYFCDMVQQCTNSMIENKVEVIRPKIPQDFLGCKVGAFEDLFLSLFAYAELKIKNGTKCIILLDNIEHILGETYADSGSSTSMITNHLTTRIGGIFLNIMDKKYFGRDSCNGSEVKLLVICTSRSRGNGSDLFDKTFYLGELPYSERIQIIKQCLGLTEVSCEAFPDMVSKVTTSTMGKSRGEIAQYCREARNRVPFVTENNLIKMRLEAMAAALECVTPESLKQISSDQTIEMRVYGMKELRSNIKIDDAGNEIFPLLGKSVNEAWSQLQNIVITPLCLWKSLDAIIFARKNASISSRKAITSGVLITGAPGSGKTAIAYHCAAVAAGLDNSIRLLDVSCTSLITKEVGGSEKSIHRLFQTARAAAPCIILLDGIDNIAPIRGNDNTTEGTMDRLLSTLLTEMDGIMEESQGRNRLESGNCDSVAVIGITHNPATWIDPALRRPGRLEKCIHLDSPDIDARKEIINRAIMDIDIDFSSAGFFDPKNKMDLAHFISIRTGGKTAADILAICQNARMIALRNSLEQDSLLVTFKDYLQAADELIL